MKESLAIEWNRTNCAVGVEPVVLSFQIDGLSKWINQPQIGTTYLPVEFFEWSLYSIIDMISYGHSEL